MNRESLIAAVLDRCPTITKEAATKILNTTLSTIEEQVAGGDKVALTGFGVFERRQRPARTGRHPRTGEPFQIPAKRVPIMSPGKTFRAAVAEKHLSEDRVG